MNLVVESEQGKIQQSFAQMKEELKSLQNLRNQRNSETEASRTEWHGVALTNTSDDRTDSPKTPAGSSENMLKSEISMLKEYQTLMEKLEDHVKERNVHDTFAGLNVDSGGADTGHR